MKFQNLSQHVININFEFTGRNWQKWNGKADCKQINFVAKFKYSLYNITICYPKKVQWILWHNFCFIENNVNGRLFFSLRRADLLELFPDFLTRKKVADFIEDVVLICTVVFITTTCMYRKFIWWKDMRITAKPDGGPQSIQSHGNMKPFQTSQIIPSIFPLFLKNLGNHVYNSQIYKNFTGKLIAWITSQKSTGHPSWKIKYFKRVKSNMHFSEKTCMLPLYP